MGCLNCDCEGCQKERWEEDERVAHRLQDKVIERARELLLNNEYLFEKALELAQEELDVCLDSYHRRVLENQVEEKNGRKIRREI
tara:strand:- start:369 stop:623 length:255 start_codon:yes stop_codon:yes gene_type:complete